MKLIKAYAAIALCVAIIVGAAGAIIVAKERTELLSVGETDYEKVFLSESQRLSDSEGKIYIDSQEIKSKTEQLIEIAPPLNQIYWIYKNIKACF